MSEFVKSESVFVGQPLSSRAEVLRFIADKAVDLAIADNGDAVYEAFIARENLGETGMVDGFAVPHAKTDAIGQPAVIVVKVTQALEWPSFDGKPCDIFLSLLVPDTQAGTTHIKLLSKAAVLLMREEFKEFMRSNDDPATIAATMNAAIDES